jgi:hypothetical protein
MSNQLITSGCRLDLESTDPGVAVPLPLDGFVHAWRVDGIDAASLGGLAVA